MNFANLPGWCEPYLTVCETPEICSPGPVASPVPVALHSCRDRLAVDSTFNTCLFVNRNHVQCTLRGHLFEQMIQLGDHDVAPQMGQQSIQFCGYIYMYTYISYYVLLFINYSCYMHIVLMMVSILCPLAALLCGPQNHKTSTCVKTQRSLGHGDLRNDCDISCPTDPSRVDPHVDRGRDRCHGPVAD